MIIWEFFAGSRSFSKVAESRGHTTYTTDIIDFDGIDQHCDIFDFDIGEALRTTGPPHILWFSPPCKYFSVASCYHHWDYDGNVHTPKTEGAKLGLEILNRINKIIEFIDPEYYIIENPRGIMRKMPHMTPHMRDTVWYCRYGDTRAKPTDLWTNFGIRLPRTCKNSNPECHHEKTKRSSNKGTQGIQGRYNRSIVPPLLCNEILEQIEDYKLQVLQHWRWC